MQTHRLLHLFFQKRINSACTDVRITIGIMSMGSHSPFTRVVIPLHWIVGGVGGAYMLGGGVYMLDGGGGGGVYMLGVGGGYIC